MRQTKCDADRIFQMTSEGDFEATAVEGVYISKSRKEVFIMTGFGEATLLKVPSLE